MQEFDIAVVGGGPAGLLAALSLCQFTNHTIALLAAPYKPDNRTSALMAPSLKLLEKLTLWDALAPLSAPLQIMRLVDDTGRLLRAPTLNFDANDVRDGPFGWNIPNTPLCEEVLYALQKQPNFVHIPELVLAFSHRENSVSLSTQDGEYSAKVIVAADGRRSLAREAAGISARFFDHPQTALTTSFDHEKPHNGVSTEFHRPSGPFTLVPLPGQRSSLVWVETPEKAKGILALSDEYKLAEIQKISRGVLGKITNLQPVQAFPLQSMKVGALAANRTFLIGEAAHVFPPIGAQGLNLTIRDIAQLIEIFDSSDLSQASKLESGYDKARKDDTWSRILGVNLLNYSLILPYAPVQAMRYLGMSALSRLSPVRKTAMLAGIAPKNLPNLLQ